MPVLLGPPAYQPQTPRLLGPPTPVPRLPLGPPLRTEPPGFGFPGGWHPGVGYLDPRLRRRRALPGQSDAARRAALLAIARFGAPARSQFRTL